MQVSREFHRIPTDNFPSQNYFEKIASFSKHGLLVVAGNDDPPFARSAISGKKVYNLHEKPFIIENYAFLGLEGATSSFGSLLYSEKQVKDHLDRMLREIHDKEIIILSHAPPHGILDVGIRFGIDHIGSTSLREFIDKHQDKVRMVICGHSHIQGGKSIMYKGIIIVNCASRDRIGCPGKIAKITFHISGSNIGWEDIHDRSPLKGEDLINVPLVGHSRRKLLSKAGVKKIDQLAKLSPNHELSRNPAFLGVFELIINYAKAIVAEKPIVIGIPPSFEKIKDSSSILFFDSEYNPVGAKNGKFGIFLIGWMDIHGKVRQIFLDDPKKEKDMLINFRNLLVERKPILVTYSSTSADKPQLVNNFKRFGIPTTEINESFFDLYYDCINTQRKKDQFIFLPMYGSMRMKDVSCFLGFKEPFLAIQDGLQALIKYKQFLDEENENTRLRIKRELLAYNRSDLERTRFVFEKLRALIYANDSTLSLK